MSNFSPSVCKDHFFNDPHKIIELTNQIEFKPTKYISGKRSDFLHVINKPLHDYVNKIKIFQLIVIFKKVIQTKMMVGFIQI